MNFACIYSHQITNLVEADMIDFVAFLTLANLGSATVCMYMAGVHHHLCTCALPDFSNSFALALVLKGLNTSIDKSPDVRIPISLNMLHDMCRALQHICNSAYWVAMYTVLFTLALHGLLHPGEVTFTTHAIF